jgi:hypothetical protein
VWFVYALFRDVRWRVRGFTRSAHGDLLRYRAGACLGTRFGKREKRFKKSPGYFAAHWDHIVECSLDSLSGRLALNAPVGR